MNHDGKSYLFCLAARLDFLGGAPVMLVYSNLSCNLQVVVRNNYC